MNVATVSIQVDNEAAKIYTSASVEQQQKLQMLFSTLLHEFNNSPRALLALMDEISNKAKAKGLTPDILDALLDEEKS